MGNLPEGEIQIAAVALFANDYQAEDRIKLRIDRSPPSITTIDPEANTIIPANQVEVSVAVDDASPVWVYVNDGPADKELDRYVRTVTLNDGHRDISFRLIDLAGNTYVYEHPLTFDTKPPFSFSVGAEPSGWTNITQPVISFSATDETSGILEYYLWIDDGPRWKVTSPYQVPPLENGIHDVYVLAVDRAGWGRLGQTQVFIDKTPPIAPKDFAAVPGADSIELAWEQPEEDVVSYRVYREPSWDNGYVITEEPYYLDLDVGAGLEYSYRVSAIDHAGNEGEMAGPITVRPGLEKEPYRPGEEVLVEYESSVLIVPADTFSADEALEVIQIEEIYSEDLRSLAA